MMPFVENYMHTSIKGLLWKEGHRRVNGWHLQAREVSPLLFGGNFHGV